MVEEIIIAITYCLIVVPLLVVLLLACIYYFVKSSEYERKYIDSLKGKERKAVLEYKHRQRVPLSYLLGKEKKKDENK